MRRTKRQASDEENEPGPGPLPPITGIPEEKRDLPPGFAAMIEFGADDDRIPGDTRLADDADDARDPFKPGQLDIPGLAPELDRIVQRVFSIDVDEMDRELDGALRMKAPPSATTISKILDELEEADEKADMAHRLYATAAKARDDFEIDVTTVESELRERARISLEAEKSAGDRKKAITKDDIDGWIASNYQDHYREMEKRRIALKRAVEYFERRADLFSRRANHLDTIARSGRSTAT